LFYEKKLKVVEVLVSNIFSSIELLLEVINASTSCKKKLEYSTSGAIELYQLAHLNHTDTICAFVDLPFVTLFLILNTAKKCTFIDTFCVKMHHFEQFW
jgi:hypothetical protein